jgi:hypothetical protein
MISAMSTIYSTIIGGWNRHHRAKICRTLIGTASHVAADAGRPLLACRATAPDQRHSVRAAGP